MPKKLDANVSSLFDLKAELYKKQAESSKHVQATDTSKVSYARITSNRLFQKQKQNVSGKKTQQSKIKMLEKEALEEDRKLREARTKLEQKALLYEKLMSKNGCPDNEQAQMLLVDFSQKAVDAKQTSEPCDNDVPEYSGGADQVDAVQAEEEWVEFVDSFGRTRTCLRTDLPQFLKADEKVKTIEEQKRPKDLFANSHELLSSDMRKELERQQWEKQESEEHASGPVHYQHVLKDEAWNHGVAYFQFSKDEEVRRQQMQALEHMEVQAQEQRKRNEQLKSKRKLLMENRLKRIRDRKQLKGEDDIFGSDNDDEASVAVDPSGIPLPSQSETSTSSVVSPPSDISAMVEEELRSRKRASYVRPWDEGKKKLSQDDWVSKRRDDRNPEFAPYYH